VGGGGGGGGEFVARDGKGALATNLRPPRIRSTNTT
jgi:hypothetical protein